MSLNRSHSSLSSHNRFLNPAWLRRLLNAYPLPMPEDDECRDEFLQNVFASFTPPMMISLADSSSSSMTMYSQKSKGVTFKSMTVDGMDIEGNLMGAFMTRTDKGSRLTVNSSRSRDSITTINIKKVMLDRLDNVAQLLSVLAILYALHNLRAKLYMLLNVWNPHVTYDKTLRMFSWSLKDYYTRFHHKNVFYCETFAMEVGDQLECVKYRTDLAETIRVLDVIIQDIERMRDLCDRSMKALKDAQTDIFHLLTQSEQAAHRKYEDIMLEFMKRPAHRAARIDISKLTSIHCTAAIEARYEINWNKTSLDQAEMFDRRKCEEMIRELAWLKSETTLNELTWNTSQTVYDIQILKLKQQIANWEFFYEEEMFNMDLKIDSTKAKLSKAKDDLQFLKDQIPIFHEKIAKTQDIIEQRELMKLRASRKSIRNRVSRNSKSVSLPPKRKSTKKKPMKKK